METMSGLDGLGWPNPEDEPKPKIMSDTPRADDQSVRYYDDATGTRIEYVAARFARQLERELTQRKRERDEAIQARKDSAADWLNQVRNADFRVARIKRERDRLDDQLDQTILRLGGTQERMIDAERQRDKLAEALKLVAEGSLCCACRGSAELVSIADEALNQLNL